MANIQVTKTESNDNVTKFGVTAEGHNFTVHVSDEYYQQLTDGNITREQLVEESFEFLLEREPVTSILSEFDLPTIQKYFEDYEQSMRSAFGD